MMPLAGRQVVVGDAPVVAHLDVHEPRRRSAPTASKRKPPREQWEVSTQTPMPSRGSRSRIQEKSSREPPSRCGNGVSSDEGQAPGRDSARRHLGQALDGQGHPQVAFPHPALVLSSGMDDVERAPQDGERIRGPVQVVEGGPPAGRVGARDVDVVAEGGVEGVHAEARVSDAPAQSLAGRRGWTGRGAGARWRSRGSRSPASRIGSIVCSMGWRYPMPVEIPVAHISSSPCPGGRPRRREEPAARLRAQQALADPAPLLASGR